MGGIIGDAYALSADDKLTARSLVPDSDEEIENTEGSPVSMERKIKWRNWEEEIEATYWRSRSYCF